MTIASYLVFLLFGIAALIFPTFINQDVFWFEVNDFFKTYPISRYVIGFVAVIFAVIGMSFVFIRWCQKNTIFIIQKSKRGEFGDPDLKFPKACIGSRDPLIYTNLIGISDGDEALLNLEKDNIKEFYNSIAPNKKIAFLSVSIFPFIVYAGRLVGDAGRKVLYFHYDRHKGKVRRLRHFGKCHITLNEEKARDYEKSHIATICVSVSYQIKKEIIESEFSNTDIRYFSISQPNTEAIKNIRDLKSVARTVRDVISKYNNEVNLMLSCPAELCFAIGQELASSALPKINVYNFNGNSDSNKWNWHIRINNRDCSSSDLKS